ncbi:hypothetical protein G7Y89_g9545 [Cudoniella acicularis]|uniref:AAA+ ATPase domain-containing protein n=1 Tax=Cudoniella acicularis TaxID=354080 RepID=A0A8H4REG2_9HELO|nr:hypothetical protein G7Y89_g9545 [Cudoniella acicularis]
MSKINARAFRYVLQDSIQLEDQEWSYNILNLPKSSTTNSEKLIKSITVVSNSVKQHIELGLQVISLNRAISSEPLDRFVLISFADFRLRVSQSSTDGKSSDSSDTKPATARESTDYIVKLLRSGITLNGIHYNFYGHSNSQLKSRTCFLYAAPKDDISQKVESLGDFKKIKTVPKKAKRIGLLFSVAQIATVLEPRRCEDIQDVETSDYIFTDGCGLICPRFAQELARRVGITFRNVRYTPSVFQIRYRGYKGVLMLDPPMKGETLVKFRKSMKKFSGGNDNSFSVIEYSKPYGFGYLNDEIVLLLHSLGISEAILLQKQKDHFQYLSNAMIDPRSAFGFLTYMNNIELAEKVLMDSIESVQPSINKLVNSEYDRMINKRDEQRCKILIPKSRLLFGICDAWGVLKEGECAVKITMDGDGQPRALHGMEILVSRNPCLHPGDLQKFKVVARDELAHLVDCIVFPTTGRRPAADMMSGGDLDGDKFFVCWDRDLIPEKLSQPAHYPGGKEPVTFNAITDDDRLVYFAKYTNASLGRVKNLFLDWARINGPMSEQCQQLNRLFSTCVDGNRIKIPPTLESPPVLSPHCPPFILDIIHDAAKDLIKSHQKSSHSCEGYDFDAMELLLSRDNLAMSEFELVKLTYRWCRKNNALLKDFLHLFDINLLTAEEKIWTLNQLPPSLETSSLIMNALCQSNLIQPSELRLFKLDYSGLKWKRIYDSTQDRLATFLDTVTKALELFHRKLIVVRVDERLTLAIYVPQRIEKGKEAQVDNRVRLFAFPHSGGEEMSHRLVLPTKMNYRLYCDGNVFQLFEGKRANSWIYIVRGPSNDSKYRNQKTIGDRRRGRQVTIDNETNFDCRTSVALDKFSRALQQHIGRVNRNGVLGAEIYVISNRDVGSMQNLDLWLDFVDTNEIMPLFERNAKEYTIPKLRDVDWAVEPEYIIQIAKERRFSTFSTIDSDEKYYDVFTWLLEKGEKGMLMQCFQYLLAKLRNHEEPFFDPGVKVQLMVDFLERAPFLAITFDQIGSWDKLPPNMQEVLEKASPVLLRAYILSANEMQEFVVEPFKRVMSQIKSMSMTNFSDLVELISLTVRSADIALDLLLESIEPESARILKGHPKTIQHLVRSFLGIALDHINEAAESQSGKNDMILELKITNIELGDYPVVESKLRIDAPVGALQTSDHVRLTVASSPANSITTQRCSTDALVESYEPGLARFRCFHPLPPFFKECSWKIKNCGSFVTTKTMFDAVLTLDTQPDRCYVSEHILGTLESAFSNNDTPTRGYTVNKNLNTSQNAAVESSLLSPFTCLWGPPGTGKTHTIVEIIEELQASAGTKRILVTAPTHNAVDNVMRKYLGDATKRGKLNAAKGTALRVSTDVRKVAEDLKKYTCDAMAGKEIYTSYSSLNKARDQIKKCRLIFTTCIGAGLGVLRSESFDTVIIDEASQQTEPASLVPLVKGCRKAILVGDHVQLGATVQKHAVVQQFDISLFERLYKQPTVGSGLISKVMLDTQYRMHGSICQFSSNEFYDSRLRTGISDYSRPLPTSEFPWASAMSRASGKSSSSGDNNKRMVFVECSSPEDLGRKSKTNEGQANLCHEICRKLCTEAAKATTKAKPQATLAIEQQSIAVLTPYSRQVDLLKGRLSQFPNVEVCSIDGFQGREADIIVFVTVRCNVHREIGFLKDLRRMNVALTRARAGVVVIGNRATLTMGTGDVENAAVWKRLLCALVEVRIENGRA